MSKEIYPLGQPTEITITPTEEDILTKFGLAKVKILPPQHIPIAVLPVRNENGGKIFYTLCKTCSIEKNRFPCFHTEEQRQFVGTYTTFEIQTAVANGYRIIKSYELWSWDEAHQSKEVFKKYITTFFELKVASEGFPLDCETLQEKEAFCQKINKDNDLNLTVESVKKNPGLKNTAKRLINSLWGKLAVKPGKPESRYIVQADEYFKLLRDDQYEISDVLLVSEEMVLVNYLNRNKKPGKFTNVVIASMVTSYARTWLFKKCIKQLAPWQIHYVDTDSIIYSKIQGFCNLQTGSGLGALTREIEGIFGCDDSIGEWCATGNKSYSFKLKKNPDKGLVKVKGFTLGLTANVLQDIDFNLMIEMVLSHPDTVTPIRQSSLFVKDKKHAKIYTKPREKLFQFNYDNKIVLVNKKTKPYGFVGHFPSMYES